MRRCRLFTFLCLVWLVGCGTAEMTPTARPRADQIATATQVARDTEATQVVRAVTQTAQAMPTATATATIPPTPTLTRTPTIAPIATATRTPARPSPTPTRANSIVVPPGAGEQVLVDDDLTRPGHSWYGNKVACKPGSTTQEYCQDDQGLHLLIDKPGQWAQLRHQTLPDLVDVRVDLNVTLVDNPGGVGGVGILCRYDKAGYGYILAVWSDGYYGIIRLIDGKEYLLAGSDSPSPAILPGPVEHQLHFECVGDTFVIAANGEELMRVTDDFVDYEPGQVMLYACTCRGGSLNAAYSYIRVAAAEAPPQPTLPRAVPTQVSHLPPPGFVPSRAARRSDPARNRAPGFLPFS